MQRINLFIFCCLLTLINSFVHGQAFRKSLYQKTDAVLARKIENETIPGKGRFVFYIQNKEATRHILDALHAEKIMIHDRLPVISADLDWKSIPACIQSPHILFIGEQLTPKEELVFGATDYSCNNIRLMQSAFPDYNGSNTLVVVKEHMPDSLDIDIKGRFVPGPYASSITSSHASIMSTLIGGAGNTWHSSLGVAPGTQLSSASFMNLLPEPIAYYQQSKANVQNHSYGTINQNFYGIEASAYDATIHEIPSMLHVFSAGNEGNKTPTDGIYKDISGYSNMTGNFKQAKNILTIGHTDSFFNVLPVSSAGPAHDGRIKPELVAYGEDGSSGAAALVSGIALNLQQAYQIKNNGNAAPASLIKALLINGAKDVHTPGIDFTSGYGSADAFTSMQQLVNNQYIIGRITSNQAQAWNINVPDNTSELKITLVWTDPSASPLSTKALLNNLDLELINNTTQEKWLPWTLNAYPHKDSLQLLPVRKQDTLNNTEQITISNPAAGEYAIRLLSNQLQTTDQEFSIVYHFIKANEFQWQFPNRKDIVTPNDSILLRWKSTLNETTGKVSISTDKGVSWQVISAEADLKKEWIKFSAPDIFTKAILKMETNNQSFISDTFTIGKRIETSVAFNCADSFRIFWNPVPGINKYQVYQLGTRYLEPLLTISDTGFTLSKTNAKAMHYAVAPVRDNISLTRSYTTNYSTQGVGCYIRSFLSYLNNNEGKISLSLGATYGLNAIRFEKRKLNSFITFLRQTNLSGNDFTITDPSLQNGTNIYRAVLELNNGGDIISNESSVYFLNQLKGLIYPNPISRNGQLTLLTASAVSLQIIDLTGRVVLKKEVVDSPEFISLYPLQAGMYMYRMTEKDKQVTTGKLLIID